MATDNPGIKSWLHVKLLELNGGLRYSTGKSKKNHAFYTIYTFRRIPAVAACRCAICFSLLANSEAASCFASFKARSCRASESSWEPGRAVFFFFWGCCNTLNVLEDVGRYYQPTCSPQIIKYLPKIFNEIWCQQRWLMKNRRCRPPIVRSSATMVPLQWSTA